MKKIFTFVAMLSCTLAAMAQFTAQIGQETSLNQQKMLLTPMHQENGLLEYVSMLPADFEMQDINQFEWMNVAQQPAIRKIAMGNVSATADSAIATYLGEYYYNYYKQFVGYYWQISIFDADGNTWTTQIQGVSDTLIAGTYYSVTMKYSFNGATPISTTGDFKIELAGTTEQNQPTYYFSGTFADGKGNTYTLNTNEEAYAFPEGSVQNYLAAQYCKSYKKYCDQVNISLADKEIKPTGDTTFVDMTTFTKRAYTNGYYITATGSKYLFATFLKGDGFKLEGQYEERDFDLPSTQLYELKGDSAFKIGVYKCIEATVSKQNLAYDFVIVVEDYNGQMYKIKGQYTEPVITDTINVEMKGLMNTLTTGYKLIYTVSAEYVMTLAYKTDSIIGTYTERASYNGGAYDVIAKVVGTDTIKYSIKEYTMQVTKKSTYYEYIMRAKAQNATNANDWKFFNIIDQVGPYSFDADKDLKLTFEGDYSNFSTKYFASNKGEIDFSATNDTSFVYLVFFANDTATDGTVLKQGTYNVSNTTKPLALLSSGYNTSYGPQPCYAIYVIGGVQHLWFITAGKVTVAKNQIIVDATNSLGKKVDITINFGGESHLNSIKTPAQIGASKVMKDGQLYIIRDNVLFDLQGNEVK